MAGHDRHHHAHGGDHQHGHEPGSHEGHDHGHGSDDGHPHKHGHGPDEHHGHDQDHGSDEGHGHHGHGHDGHGHSHEHGHEHGHAHKGGDLVHRLKHMLAPHSHDTADKVDSALEASRDGLRALWISLAALGATAVAQAFVVAFTGSVALLGDTLHNVADALTAIPLGIAFLLARRAATRRSTYGFGRAEDLAGIVIVLVIAASAVAAGAAAIDRLRHPAEVDHLWAVAAAGLIGFCGNELVARYRIRVGRRIGSAALVADGLHARTDGFTSLAVLLGAGGVALGWTWADPIVGLAITVAIALVLKDAARQIYRRLMDAVDPETVDKVEAVLTETSGVKGVGALRLRWVGHQLHGEIEIAVDPSLTVIEAHAIAVDAEHRLIHAIPRLVRASIHTDPADQPEAHRVLAHHG
jgi:cation diffusion facilitator family transporter